MRQLSKSHVIISVIFTDRILSTHFIIGLCVIENIFFLFHGYLKEPSQRQMLKRMDIAFSQFYFQRFCLS